MKILKNILINEWFHQIAILSRMPIYISEGISHNY